MNFPMKSLYSSRLVLGALVLWSSFFTEWPFCVCGEPLEGAATPPLSIDEEDINLFYSYITG
jgi:hypothetical protein